MLRSPEAPGPGGQGARRRVVLFSAARDWHARVLAAGYELVSADCVLIGEEPHVAPHREQMRARLASALGVPADRVNVRGTTTDRLGFTGRREGLAAEAVALLRLL